MRNIIKRSKDYMNRKAIEAKCFSEIKREKMHSMISNDRGEGYVDTAVSILISIVVGALLLAGLYKLFGDNVLPTLSKKISEMFNYKG